MADEVRRRREQKKAVIREQSEAAEADLQHLFQMIDELVPEVIGACSEDHLVTAEVAVPGEAGRGRGALARDGWVVSISRESARRAYLVFYPDGSWALASSTSSGAAAPYQEENRWAAVQADSAFLVGMTQEELRGEIIEDLSNRGS
jgi:hypothetical protein